MMATKTLNKKFFSTQILSCVLTFAFLSACSSTTTEKLKYNPSYLLKDKAVQQGLSTEQVTSSDERKLSLNNVEEVIKPFYFKQKQQKIV